MASREYFQDDQRQGSYEFVGRRGPNSRSTSPYPQQQQNQGYSQGNDSYAGRYGGQQQSQYPPQTQSYGGGDNYNQAAPPARYEPVGPSSPPPAYGQNDPYLSQYQQQYGASQQQSYNQRPQESYNQRPQGDEDSRYSHSPQPQPAHGQQNPAYGYQQEDGPGGAQGEDRGIMGGLAGAAAGGYGGHKLNHGVMGTVGGAIAGSMLENHFKKEKQEKKEHEQQQHQQQQHQGYGRPPPPPPQQSHHFSGNFSASSTDISLDRDYDLIARCGDGGGGYRLTSINLNECLTNEFGTLKWARGGNFGGSARNVRLADSGRVLEAELADGGGGWRHGFIHLDEKITNEGGELRYLD